ncbi:hypothetical protein KIW84_054895 [Lathyrus oleraceus]|uniref:PB1-like domain-containing protein n=1 Tax=Pisum sativum TaxID=3888 RepID=A0A9D4WX93_PEA|nr:hypothetical protein KIW84_054895 [Pisum sativum]
MEVGDRGWRFKMKVGDLKMEDEDEEKNGGRRLEMKKKWRMDVRDDIPLKTYDSQLFISPKIKIGEDEVTVQSRWSEAKDDLHPEEDTDESQMSQNMQVFNVVFHHGGEFVRLNDGDTIYMGGVSTIVFGKLIDKWSMVNIHKLIRNNDGAYDFAAYASTTEVDGEIFVEHDVTGIEIIVKSPRCVNEMVELDGCDDEGVEGFNDSENERTTAIADGIDVSLPINEGTIVVGLLTGSKKKKWKDDEYVNDELDNFDPDVYDDDNWPKFDKFRKDQLNKNFKFKWGMQFNSLDDFRETIRECGS